jgi:hypothetical protein
MNCNNTGSKLLAAWAMCVMTVCAHAAGSAASAPGSSATSAADAVAKLHSLVVAGAQDAIGGSPAATVLGINSDKVEHPSTVQTIPPRGVGRR